jgi:hypothetical protein
MTKPFGNMQEIRPKEDYCFEKSFRADGFFPFISTQVDVRSSLALGYCILPFQGESPTNQDGQKAFPRLEFLPTGRKLGRGLYSFGNT